MLNLPIRTLLAASVALAVTTAAVAAAPASTATDLEWTYWLSASDRIDPDSRTWRCSSEVAKIGGTATTLMLLHRAPSGSACVREAGKGELLNLTTHAPGEALVFKPEVVEGQDRLSSNWKLSAVEEWERDSGVSGSYVRVGADSGQTSFQLVDGASGRKLISSASDCLIVAVTERELSTVDLRATWDSRVQRVSFRPTASIAALSSDRPEPEFKKPKYNTNVAKIASTSALNPARILKDLCTLTGEDAQPSDIGKWHTRHSSTYGARLAARWIKRELEASLSTLAGVTCGFWAYSPYFAPNIVCNIPASPSLVDDKKEEAAVLVSAHYGSRGTFGSTTAPGGDDDGFGTAALLAIARAIGNANLTFASPIQLVAFSGEEQGLVGSQRYAEHLRKQKLDIKLALQMDMLAYRKPGEPLQIAFPDKLATKTATKHVWTIADIYAPELEQGYTPACCSDHQSFWEQGYAATWVFERDGPIADPMYHNSGDTTTRDGYDVDQLASIAKVVVATLLDVAGFEL